IKAKPTCIAMACRKAGSSSAIMPGLVSVSIQWAPCGASFQEHLFRRQPWRRPGLAGTLGAGSDAMALRRGDLVQQVDDGFGDGSVYWHDDRVLVLGRLLERLELAVQKRGRHVAVLPAAHPLSDQPLVALQIQQRDALAAAHGYPAIGTLQVRARDD